MGGFCYVNQCLTTYLNSVTQDKGAGFGKLISSPNMGAPTAGNSCGLANGACASLAQFRLDNRALSVTRAPSWGQKAPLIFRRSVGQAGGRLSRSELRPGETPRTRLCSQRVPTTRNLLELMTTPVAQQVQGFLAQTSMACSGIKVARRSLRPSPPGTARNGLRPAMLMGRPWSNGRTASVGGAGTGAKVTRYRLRCPR